MTEPIAPDGAQFSARLSQVERTTLAAAYWAEIGGPEVVSILADYERGNLFRWGNFVDRMLYGGDGWIGSKFALRIQRVAQADMRVVPGSDKPDAVILAKLCDRAIKQLPDWMGKVRSVLQAIPGGRSVHRIQWQERDGVYLPTDLIWTHQRRFQYDDQWQLRLWDNDGAKGPDYQGLLLDPGSWLVHSHVSGGYPGTYGELRGLAKFWLFMQWSSMWWVQNSERFGQPFMRAKLPKNSTEETRRKAMRSITELIGTHGAVYEEDMEIIIDAAGVASRAYESHERFMLFAKAHITEQILGTSDATGPGENGSNAAVSSRLGAFTDPLMVADGAAFAETLRRDLFYWIGYHNRALFGGAIPDLPELRFDTAADEVQVDQSDLAKERGTSVAVPGAVGEQPAATPQTQQQAQPSASDTVQDSALNGAQQQAIAAALTAVNERRMLRSQAAWLVNVGNPSVSVESALAGFGSAGTDNPAELVSSQPAQPAPAFAASREVSERARPLAAVLRARR